MYCPRCGQGQANEQIRFCSRCGFLMEGIGRFIREGGLPPELLDPSIENAVSPKKQGLKQGGIMMLSSLIVVPVLGIMTAMLNLEGFLPGVAAIVLFWGGLLRMIYALIFQPGRPIAREKAGFVDSLKQNFVGPPKDQQVLPTAYQEPAQADFQPASMNWRETADLEGVPREENATRPFNKH